MRLSSAALLGVLAYASGIGAAALGSMTSSIAQVSLTTNPTTFTTSIEPCALASMASASVKAANPSG